ncbi:MAG: sulfide/dihydroorotate dehydrogenase-like FAD/NAD-binding protein [Candidatus Omnitrophota bacterium]
MPYTIVNKQILGEGIKRLEIRAEVIADMVRPGQFVMIAPEEGKKWIPLSVMEADTRRGLISVIIKETGAATSCLGSLPIRDEVFSVSGPFGTVEEPRQVGVVVCAATDISAAQILPMCRAYSRAGNKVIGVLGARTKNELILDPQMRIACHKVVLTTEDGSAHRRGTVTDAVKELCGQDNVQLVYTCGQTEMLREIAEMTRQKKIRNLLQVHTLMSCGRGICGSCRMKVAKQLVLACEDGPEFDAHQVDFSELNHRMQAVCSRDEHQEASGGLKHIWQKMIKG